MSRQVYRLRVLGLVVGSISVATAFYENHGRNDFVFELPATPAGAA